MPKSPDAKRAARSRASKAARIAGKAASLHAYAGIDVDCESVATRIEDGSLDALGQARKCCALCWHIAGRVLKRGDEISDGDDVALGYHERRLIQIADLLARASRLYIEAEAAVGTAPEDEAPYRVIVEEVDPSTVTTSALADD